MKAELKFKGKNDDEVKVSVFDSEIEIKITGSMDSSDNFEESIMLYSDEWDKIVKFVEVVRQNGNAKIHDL